MKVFELLPRPLGKIFRKLTHLTCNLPMNYDFTGKVVQLEVAALVDDLADGVALVDPREDVDLVALDALGAEQDVVGDLAGNAEYAVDVAKDDVARPHRHLADADRNLIMRNHTASERTVGDAVLVEQWEVLLKNLLRVADAAGNHRAAYALGDCGRRHDAAPERGLHVLGGVPDDDAVWLELVEHLRTESHLSLDHHVRRTLHRERLAADGHLVAKRHDVVRKVLVEKRQFAHDVVHAARVELLETLAKFLHRDREFVRWDVLALCDELVEFHQASFLGLGAHICE